MYTANQLAAIREMAANEKRVEIPTRYNKKTYVAFKLWEGRGQSRAYLNYETAKPRYNGGTTWKSESLGYIDLRTGELYTIQEAAWDNHIGHMQIPASDEGSSANNTEWSR